MSVLCSDCFPQKMRAPCVWLWMRIIWIRHWFLETIQFDIKVQLSGSNTFSKLDFKSEFGQLQLHPGYCYFTVFHANNKLYRYTRLIIWVRPAQSELNVALKAIFGHITHVFLIQDDLIIATKTTKSTKKTPFWK